MVAPNPAISTPEPHSLYSPAAVLCCALGKASGEGGTNKTGLKSLDDGWCLGSTGCSHKTNVFRVSSLVLFIGYSPPKVRGSIPQGCCYSQRGSLGPCGLLFFTFCLLIFAESGVQKACVSVPHHLQHGGLPQPFGVLLAGICFFL